MKKTTLLPAALLALAGSAHAAVIVSESFGGLAADNLNGSSADIFDPAIVTAGGSSTWVAKAFDVNNRFRADGTMVWGASTTVDARAHLDLGTYINDTKGTANGIFTFQATMVQPTGGNSSTTSTATWVSFGMLRTEETANDMFTVNSSGIFTSLLRKNDPSGTSDLFFGLGSGGGTDHGIFTGTNTYTMTLDLTPASGYNGTTNNGTVKFEINGSGVVKTYSYTGPQDYRYVGFTVNDSAATTLSNFTVTQVPEPSALLLGALGLLPLLRRKR